MSNRVSHIRAPMTVHSNDHNLCYATISSADIPLREAQRTSSEALRTSLWNVCPECLAKLDKLQHEPPPGHSDHTPLEDL